MPSKLPKPSAGDHAIRGTKALVAAFPGGGIIASLIGDYIPESRQRAIDELLNQFTNQLRQFGDRLDTEFVTKGEFKTQFAELYDASLLLCMHTRQEEKIRGAGTILANLLLKGDDPAKIDYAEAEFFVRCLDSLSIGAIKVIGVVQKIADRKPGYKTNKLIRVDFREIAQAMPDEDRHFLMGLVGELASFNLLHSGGRPTGLGTGGTYESYMFELTPLGSRFVRQVLGSGS